MKSYGDHMGNGHEPGDSSEESDGAHGDFASGAKDCGHDIQAPAGQKRDGARKGRKS